MTVRGKCARYTQFASFTRKDKAGLNTVEIKGRFGNRALVKGAYKLELTPTASGQSGKTATIRFRSSKPYAATRLRLLSSQSDTKSLIETAVTRFLEEVPALQSLKLVAGLDLRARGDVQQYRIELPGPKVTKDIAADSKVRIEVQRSEFNTLATKGYVKDWREAFASGRAKATGIDQVMKLIVNVVDRQDERSRTRKAKL